MLIKKRRSKETQTISTLFCDLPKPNPIGSFKISIMIIFTGRCLDILQWYVWRLQFFFPFLRLSHISKWRGGFFREQTKVFTSVSHCSLGHVVQVCSTFCFSFYCGDQLLSTWNVGSIRTIFLLSIHLTTTAHVRK